LCRGFGPSHAWLSRGGADERRARADERRRATGRSGRTPGPARGGVGYIRNLNGLLHVPIPLR
jgi:hypothetical protein